MEDRIMDKAFWKKAFIRAGHTVVQTALATLTAASVSDYINWGTVFSTALLAGVYSLLKSISIGLPEIQDDGQGE